MNFNASVKRVSVFNEEEIDQYFKDKVLIEINQSHKLIALADNLCFFVYSIPDLLSSKEFHPIINKVQSSIKFGLAHLSIQGNTRIFVIVPNKSRGPYASSKVLIWDEMSQDQQIVESYDFNQRILKIVNLKEFIAVSSEERILLFNLTTKTSLRFINYFVNPLLLEGTLCYDTFILCYLRETNKIALINFWVPNSGPLIILDKSENPPSDIDLVKLSYTGEIIAYTTNDHQQNQSLKINSTLQQDFDIQVSLHWNHEKVVAMHFNKDTDFFFYLIQKNCDDDLSYELKMGTLINSNQVKGFVNRFETTLDIINQPMYKIKKKQSIRQDYTFSITSYLEGDGFQIIITAISTHFASSINFIRIRQETENTFILENSINYIFINQMLQKTKQH